MHMHHVHCIACKSNFFKMDNYFFSATLDSSTVVEKIDENTLIFYQVHKRIWPASQRDAIFWSHKKCVPNHTDAEGQEIWTVTNHSVDLQEFPVSVKPIYYLPSFTKVFYI